MKTSVCLVSNMCPLIWHEQTPAEELGMNKHTWVGRE